MKLSVVCVTQALPRVWPFLRHFEDVAARCDAELVLCGDGLDAVVALSEGPVAGTIVSVRSRGFIEDVLDTAIAACSGEYVLRLDDDEKCSPAMVQWLAEKSYLAADRWAFPRAHLWGDPHTVLLEQGYFPDYQDRLSIRTKAGGWVKCPHSLSPLGYGNRAPVCLEHWCYLVKTLEEHRAIAAFYENRKIPDSWRPGPTGRVRLCGYRDGAMPIVPGVRISR